MHWTAYLPLTIGLTVAMIIGYDVLTQRRQNLARMKARKLIHDTRPPRKPPVAAINVSDEFYITIPEQRAAVATRDRINSIDALAENDIDEALVQLSTRAMRVALNKARSKGKSGWWCKGKYPDALLVSLVSKVESGDYVDAMTYAAMLYFRQLNASFKTKKRQQIEQARDEILERNQREEGAA